MNAAGPKMGWWIGGLGSLVWLLVLAAVWASHGQWLGMAAGVGVFAAGVAYLFLLAPWRLPHTPLRRLYLGFLLILLAGVGVAIWQYWQALGSHRGMPLLVTFTLLIPFFTLGKRTWAQLHGE